VYQNIADRANLRSEMEVDEQRRPPGRPRNEEADREIIAATLRLLAEQGYERTSIEAVAAEAEVTRATVYRRYPSKSQLVCAAVGSYPVVEDPSDPADLREFLVQAMAAFREGVRECDGVAICSTLYLNRQEHPEMLEEFARSIIRPRQARLQAALDAGVEAGSLRQGLDTTMIVAMLFGAGIQQMLTGGDLPESWPRRVVDAVWPLLAPAS
jgi:AcrR family transcriptional regulator